MLKKNKFLDDWTPFSVDLQMTIFTLTIGKKERKQAGAVILERFILPYKCLFNIKVFRLQLNTQRYHI